MNSGTLVKVEDQGNSLDVDWEESINFILNDVSDEELDAYFSQFAYQGFDPKLVRRLSLQVGNLKDIVQIITLTLRQGTNLSKLGETLNNDGKLVFRALSTKLNLSYVDGTIVKVPREVITVQRIQASFPEIVATLIVRMYHEFNYISVGATRDEMEAYPYILFPSAGSIIPRDNLELLNAWSNWNKRFSKVINRRRKDFDMSNQVDFEQIIADSPLFSDSERRAIITKLSRLHSDKIQERASLRIESQTATSSHV